MRVLLNFWIVGACAFVAPKHIALNKPTLASLSSTGILAQNYDDQCDVLILGSGPGARSLAALLSKDGDLDVLLADQNFDREWAPNYDHGVGEASRADGMATN